MQRWVLYGVLSGAALDVMGRLTAAGFAQWDFNGDLRSAVGGAALVQGYSAPADAPQITLSTVALGTGTAQVATFTRGTHLRATHGLGANGGGARLNQFTLILDLRTPNRPTGWAGLYQTNPANTDDGEWYINPSRGLGISGNYGGVVPDGAWVRLSLVVDAVAGTFTSYLNGQAVQQNTGLTLDGRWTLGPDFLLFADDDAENAPGSVNSVQVRDWAMSSAELLALGGPTPAGIPRPVTDPTRFGQPLLGNGGFESQLAGWSTAQGRPVSVTASAGRGQPHGGGWFLFGGARQPGDFVLRQELDLVGLGFSPSELAGAVVETDGWLRNRYGAGTFDDQVFYRVAFLAEAGEELASVRCLVAGDSQWLRRSLAAPLPDGTRRLRLEVIGRHRRDADNDSKADDLSVRLRRPGVGPAVLPVITKRPMLQGIRPDAMTLLWETDRHDGVSVVEYGRQATTERTEGRVETLQIDGTHFVHRATLTGLERETEYVYRVRSGAAVSSVYGFRTAPRVETPFVTAWWGDNHNGTATLRKHVANLLSHGPDLICVAGDMVNNGNVMQEWHDYWFKPLEHLNAAQTTPVIFARGNHDGEHALAYAYSALPGNESWYAFDYGNSRFIFLDSEADGSVSPEQLAWLRAELERPGTRQAAFRIVCFHKPPWSNFWNGGGHTQEPFVINEWVPLFKANGVDLVVCGHEHAYHRGERDGTVYVVSGGGGGFIDTERVAQWPHIKVEFTQYHFDVMTVNGRRLAWETYNDQGRLLDEFAVVSRLPVLRLGTNPAGDPVVRVEGRAGTTYQLEEATELGQWRPLGQVTVGTVAGVNGWPLVSTDAARFIRVGWMP